MNPADLLVAGPAERDAIKAAIQQLDGAHSSDATRPRTASAPGLGMGMKGAVELLLMVLLPCGALLAFKPQLMTLWQNVMLWWSERLGLPLDLVRTGNGESLEWLASYMGPLMPDPVTSLITAVVVISAFVSTWWMSDRQVPLKYLVRTLCVVQASALLFFTTAPSRFPYTITGHLAATLNAGFYLMLAVPVLLALGWGVLRLPLHQKLLAPLLMITYFAVLLPHQALLHAMVVLNFSALFMPLLYLCFGAVLNLMIFVALYSWLVSVAPAQALPSGESR